MGGANGATIGTVGLLPAARPTILTSSSAACSAHPSSQTLAALCPQTMHRIPLSTSTTTARRHPRRHPRRRTLRLLRLHRHLAHRRIRIRTRLGAKSSVAMGSKSALVIGPATATGITTARSPVAHLFWAISVPLAKLSSTFRSEGLYG